MITETHTDGIVPGTVFSWQDSRMDWFYKNDIYGFLKNIDPAKVSIYLNMTHDNKLPLCKTPYAIFTMFGESPRWEVLETLCQRNPDTKVLLLADLDIYDYPLPDQVTFFPYRSWIWILDWFIYSGSTVTRVKNKIISKKISSLSFKKTQYRALVTAFLLSNMKNDSIVSWHNSDENPTSAQWIQTFRSNSLFESIDWEILDHAHLLDNFSWDLNDPEYNLKDINIPAYNNCLFNAINETHNFGYFNDGTTSYNRPGPYLTEKTWKTLLTGCIPINSGQPGLFQWLDQAYDIPTNWNTPTKYDCCIFDFDRAVQLLEVLETIRNQPLSQLIESNIDYCQEVQDKLLDPGYLEQIYKKNKIQDHAIVEFCSKL
jgi:hypothetical protein